MSQLDCNTVPPVDVDTTPCEPTQTAVVSSEVATTAHHYVEQHGLAVFPCQPGKKIPATANGFKAAVTDAAAVDALFKDGQNLAVRTGSSSGIFVLDVDEPGGGETLSVLEEEHGTLPATVSATTPRGGRHFYFKMPEDTSIRCSAGQIGNKLDIRGDGGYVVAPPSSTQAGDYAWVPGRGIDESEIADAPTWLVKLVSAPVKTDTAAASLLPLEPEDSTGNIAKGSRNASLTRLGGSMRHKGFGEVAILAALNAENASRCKPPLPAKEVQKIAESLARYKPGAKLALSDAALPYRAFPVDALPRCLAAFVDNAASTIGCDASYVALPLLAGLASAIGNSCRIELKAGWTEPSIIWTALMGNSGTKKSPAIEHALSPVRERQQAAMAAYELESADYAAANQLYEREQANWKKLKSTADPPVAPERPILSRTWVDDTTVEALAPLLLQQPRGLLLASDELAGWLGGFDRYSQGGGDSARWLEMHGGRQMVVDRKTGEPKTLCVPRASVSVTGGIQPGVLNRALGQHHRENGLAARLLIANPPSPPRRWSEAEVDAQVLANLTDVYNKLYDLTGDPNAPSADPRIIPLSADAKQCWIEFYNQHGEEVGDLDGDLAAAFSKLEGYAARLALVLHLSDWASGEVNVISPINEQSLQRALQLVVWFKYETRRVYGLLSLDDEERQVAQLVEKLRSLGGKASPRELNRSSRAWPTSADAELALNSLSDRGLGEWKVSHGGSKGGRPKREFALFDSQHCDGTPSTRS